MGLAEWFSIFCANLSIQNRETISYRYKVITQRLNTDFWDTSSDVYHSLYVGSYGRNTAIHSISDVDMIFTLPFETYAQYNGYVNNGQSALLQAVRNSLRTTYASSDLGADGQVVAINFNDGITFEIVPAFVNTNGSFTFGNSHLGGYWSTTNPRAEIQAIHDRNSTCNNNLISLIQYSYICLSLTAILQSNGQDNEMTPYSIYFQELYTTFTPSSICLIASVG